MKKVSYIFWRDGDCWLGYLEEYPDYYTEGKTLEELKENLISLYQDLTKLEIPYIKKRGILEVA